MKPAGLIFAVLVLTGTDLPAALDVRVQAEGGVPRLLVDGKPVRARMFWGVPGSAPVPVGPQASVQSFEFVPDTACDTGTLHFRFGEAPGDLFIDDVRIVDAETGREILATVDFEAADAWKQVWSIWPPDQRNTVGAVSVEKGKGSNQSAALHIRLAAPPKGAAWPDFHLYSKANLKLEQGRRYRVSFWARSDPPRQLRVAVYRPGNPYEQLGAPGDCFATQIKLAAGAGVDFVSFPIGMPWPEPGKPASYREVDAACQRVLRANPKALLLPRVGMEVPNWWARAHPDEMMAWEDGSRRSHYAVPGDIYTRDACAQLAALIQHLEATLGDRIAGYHPCGQNTGEWFYEATWGPLLNGYAPADQRQWRRWLAGQYANDDALRKAWNQPDAAIETATVPAAALRHAAPSGILHDPVKQRPLIDFARFQQEMMADCVNAQARTIRQATAGRKLSVFFYGYGFEFGAVHTGPAVSGHYALRRVLNSPDIDVLCSPISYTDRALGQSGPAMTAAESVALAGKMWLAEDDTATYLSTGTPPGHLERVRTIEETNELLARNVAQESLRNFGTWWMDLTATGWFSDQRMWDLMMRLEALDRAMLERPRKFEPEIAAILDESSMLLVAQGGTAVTRPGIYEVRRALARSGAPYGQYLLDDLIAGGVKAKVYVMLNAWQLSPEQRRGVLAATRGATVIWCYAPGCFDGDRASPEAMQELTGFALKRLPPGKAWAEPTEAGKKAGMQAFGSKASVDPLFAANEAAPDDILAKYPDGSAAVAMRKLDRGTSIFVGAPGLTPPLLRLAAGQGGAHLFTQSDCNVYANGPFIALHAAADGPVELDTGKGGGEVRDVLTGESLGKGPRITVPIKFGQTRVLECR